MPIAVEVMQHKKLLTEESVAFSRYFLVLT